MYIIALIMQKFYATLEIVTMRQWRNIKNTVLIRTCIK